jgi:predicted CopG family antitoxin
LIYSEYEGVEKIMLNKTIRVSEEVHELLSGLATKNDSYNDVIKRLIEDNEEFTDEQAEFYNQEIERVENGIHENVTEITLSELEARVAKLEQEIKHDL